METYSRAVMLTRPSDRSRSGSLPASRHLDAPELRVGGGQHPRRVDMARAL